MIKKNDRCNFPERNGILERQAQSFGCVCWWHNGRRVSHSAWSSRFESCLSCSFLGNKKHSKPIVGPCLKRFKADRFDQKLFQLGHFVLHRRLAQVWQSLWRSF